MTQIRKIKNSALEMRNVYSLSGIAMLLALRVVLGCFGNGTLAFFGNNIKLSGAFLPIAITGVMFGPIPAALVGAFGDIISLLIVPTGGAYFPGFTISGILTGLIYGFAFYKNEVSIARVVIAWVVNALTVEILIAAYWLYIINGAGPVAIYYTYLVPRLISRAVLCIPEILLILGVGKLAVKIALPRQFKKSH